MKRRLSPRTLVAGGGALAVALIVGVALVPDLRTGASGASPATLNRIERKNDRAAAEAAARMGADSRASTRAAESLRAAQERGSDEANATLARFANDEAELNLAAPGAKQ